MQKQWYALENKYGVRHNGSYLIYNTAVEGLLEEHSTVLAFISAPREKQTTLKPVA